jgi:hypothetical protein
MTADVYSSNHDRWAVTTDNGPHMPARRAIAVTPSDTLDVTNSGGDNAPCYASGLYVGVSGDVAVVTAADNSNNGAGTAVTFKAVPVGPFPVQVRRVMSTNTAATNIVGLYHQ